jgi:transcription elongation factor Elf1|tara:strand:+ start:172 stop:351 length:180 start_codon:yes stop_codon:yes gene_type:complete
MNQAEFEAILEIHQHESQRDQTHFTCDNCDHKYETNWIRLESGSLYGLTECPECGCEPE